MHTPTILTRQLIIYLQQETYIRAKLASKIPSHEFSTIGYVQEEKKYCPGNTANAMIKKKVIEILVESGKTQDIASKGFLASFGIF